MGQILSLTMQPELFTSPEDMYSYPRQKFPILFKVIWRFFITSSKILHEYSHIL